MRSATGSWRRLGTNGRFVDSKPLDHTDVASWVFLLNISSHNPVGMESERLELLTAITAAPLNHSYRVKVPAAI